MPRPVVLRDAARVDALINECARRGLIEDAAGDVRATRAWKGHLQRAAEVLNRQAAETGPPPGHPIALAVRKALSMTGERFGDDEEDVVALLTLLELAEMPESKRAEYGPYAS